MVTRILKSKLVLVIRLLVLFKVNEVQTYSRAVISGHLGSEPHSANHKLFKLSLSQKRKKFVPYLHARIHAIFGTNTNRHAMTLAEKSSLSSSIGSSYRSKKKQLPKRAVSFVESIKFQAAPPLVVQVQHQENQERREEEPQWDHLQATNKRRRYLRRGSKCPSMMLLGGMANFESLLQDDSDDDGHIDAKKKECNDDNKIMLHRQQATIQQQARRRLSLMSALKVALESSCVVAASSKTATTATTLAVSRPVERRMSTFQLLSFMSEDDTMIGW
jgi:hypothetical protein